MRARDLRIGNYILDTNFPERLAMVGRLNNGSEYPITYFYSKAYEHSPIKAEGLEGIPLTEDWLIKFGLLDNSIGIWNNGDAIYFNYGFEKSVKLHHVHQLQNLYFALTGEELKLN